MKYFKTTDEIFENLMKYFKTTGLTAQRLFFDSINSNQPYVTERTLWLHKTKLKFDVPDFRLCWQTIYINERDWHNAGGKFFH